LKEENKQPAESPNPSLELLLQGFKEIKSECKHGKLFFDKAFGLVEEVRIQFGKPTGEKDTHDVSKICLLY